MKISFTIPLLLIVYFSLAQANTDPKLKSLIDAEWNFINIARDKNTRDAFITCLADDAITFGTEIQVGKKHLEAQRPNDSWLYWEPVYSVVAASGDFGFNTGPWEFRPKRDEEKAVAFGQFVTVWKKVNGEWKAAIDIGISHKAPSEKEVWKTSTIKSEPSRKDSTNKDYILNVEEEFEKAAEQDHLTAYRQLLSQEARLYRTNQHPYTSRKQVEAYLNTYLDKVSFTPIDASVSSSGDLAFVYGKAVVHEETPRDAFFMRIWRLENGEWKIVLDIIS